VATQPDTVLFLNAIQLVRLFARLIGDSQPFWANPRWCPKRYNKIQSQ